MSAGAQIDWDAAAKQAGVPLAGGASTSSTGGGIDWDAAERQAKAPASATQPGFWSGFKSTFAPTALYRTAKDVAKSEYGLFDGASQRTPEEQQQAITRQDSGLERMLAGPGAMLLPTAEEDEEAKQTGQDPFKLHASHMKESVSQVSGRQAAGMGAGMAANALLPKFLPSITPEAEAGEDASLIDRVKAPPVINATRRFVKGLRAKPEEIEQQASEPLEAATGQQQTRLNTALKTARQNVSPPYENVHATDAARNPEGAVQIPEDVAKKVAPKAAAAEKLNAKELSDAGLAGKQATRFIANGMSDAEARRTLTGLGYSPKVVRRAMEDVAYPEQEGGGYTIEKARALRSKLHDAADAAEGREDFQSAAAYRQDAKDVTNAMRDRVRDLDPQGRLLADFDKADAAYGQAREDQRVLRPLTDALEGDRTPSAEKFQKAWDGMTSAQRNALGRLARNAGLDAPEMEQGAATTGKVLRGTRPVSTNWMDRYIKGVIPARVGIATALGAAGYYSGKNQKIPEWARETMYMLPMLVGYGGVGMMKPILARGEALEALGDLPEAMPRPSYAPTVPIVTREQLERELAQGSSQFMPSTGARRALPETTEPRVLGPRRQLPPSSAPSGEPINAMGNVRRALPGGRMPRPVRGLLARQNTNVLPSRGGTITPGARRALPPAGSQPEAPIRTRSGNIIEGGRGKIAARLEATTVRGAEIDAEINRLEDRLWQAPNNGVARQIQDRIRELNTEKRALLRNARDAKSARRE